MQGLLAGYPNHAGYDSFYGVEETWPVVQVRLPPQSFDFSIQLQSNLSLCKYFRINLLHFLSSFQARLRRLLTVNATRQAPGVPGNSWVDGNTRALFLYAKLYLFKDEHDVANQRPKSKFGNVTNGDGVTKAFGSADQVKLKTLNGRWNGANLCYVCDVV